MDNIYKRIGDDIEVIEECTEESLIQKFFTGKTVFFTGSTGFMGKAFVEKLLRDCPGLKCLYVLIRQKRGLSVEERMKNFCADVVFDRLREMYPDFESKIHAMEGDLAHDNLGLSETDVNKVIEEADLVIHNAASVKFTDKISVAAKTNVIGTAMAIDLAMKCKKVQGFMYVSTAYSHSYQLDIKEETYPPPADLDMVKKLIAVEEAIPGGFSQKDLNRLLGKFPNTYVYTKAAAEGLVSEASKRAPFPCLIYRPAIVTSSWREPIQAWVDNLNGPGMAFLGYGLGVIHVGISMDEIIDFIPVDMAVNIMFVIMWDAIENRRKTPDVLVYNYGSSIVNPISIFKLRDFIIAGRTIEQLNPSVYSVWTHFLIRTYSWWVFWILHFVFHFIPALLFDGYLLVTGKKPIALSALRKITSMTSVVAPFVLKEYMIDITESSKAISRTNSVDHKLFFCDLQELDWTDYALNYWNGLRLYILKDPLSTVPQALRKYKKLQLAHNCIQVGLIALIAYFILTRFGLM